MLMKRSVTPVENSTISIIIYCVIYRTINLLCSHPLFPVLHAIEWCFKADVWCHFSQIPHTNSVINLMLTKSVTPRGVCKVVLFPALSNHTVNNWSRYVHSVLKGGGKWISRAGWMLQISTGSGGWPTYIRVYKGNYYRVGSWICSYMYHCRNDSLGILKHWKKLLQNEALWNYVGSVYPSLLNIMPQISVVEKRI
jgi:hypothetical protein